MKASQPIGIFDSGIGGLTVANAIHQLLPHENLIYFGDTAHLPYGDKSVHAIQAYAVKICDLLIQQECKLILIACNSASAAAYQLAAAYTASKAKVMNVIDPMVEYVAQRYPDTEIGLIGTRATVSAGVYRRKIIAQKKNIKLKSVATPLLASMIEEGFFDNSVSKVVIEKYLSNKKLSDIKALLLACTHYPLIKKDIENFYQGSTEVVDGSHIVAEALKSYLTTHNLLNPQSEESKMKFYVSDYTASFEASTNIFFKKKVHLEEYPLWE